MPEYTLLDYIDAVGEGLENGWNELLDIAKHPWTNFAVPVSVLLYDTGVILAGQVENNPRHLMDMGYSDLLNPTPFKNGPTYQASLARMEMRWEAIKKSGKKFRSADDLKKTSMISEEAATILVPVASIKYFGRVAKGAKALKTAGITTMVTHSDSRTLDRTPDLLNANPTMSWVSTEDGQLHQVPKYMITVLDPHGRAFFLHPNAESFTPSERLAWDKTLKELWLKGKHHSLQAENRFANPEDLSPSLSAKIKASSNVESFIRSIDSTTRETIASEGSVTDKSVLEQVQNIEAYEVLRMDETAEAEQSFNQKLQRIYTLHDAGFAFAQMSNLAHTLGNQGFSRVLGGVSGVATLGAGVSELSLGMSWSGFGMAIAGFTTLISVMGVDDEGDNNEALMLAFQTIYNEVQAVRQDIAHLKEYLIHTDSARHAFLVNSFKHIDHMFVQVEHAFDRLLQSTTTIHYDGTVIRAGIDQLFRNDHQKVLAEANSYGRGRPMTLSQLTQEKYFELIIGLRRLIEEASVDYHTGRLIYQTELKQGTTAALGDLEKLTSTGQAFGYFSALLGDKAGMRVPFNPNTWLAAANAYLRLRGSHHPYDVSGAELKNIIADGEEFMVSMATLQSQVRALTFDYLNHAKSAVGQLKLLNQYDAKVVSIVNGDFLARTAPADSSILQGRECQIPKEFFGLESVGLGRFNHSWVLKGLRFDPPSSPNSVAGKHKIYSKKRLCHADPCPSLEFIHHSGEAVVVIRGDKVGDTYTIVNGLREYHCIMEQGLSADRASQLLMQFREQAIQQKLADVAGNFSDWEGMFQSLVKAKAACWTAGYDPAICSEIPTFTLDKKTWEYPLQAALLDAKATYRTPLPPLTENMGMLSLVENGIRLSESRLQARNVSYSGNAMVMEVEHTLQLLQARFREIKSRPKATLPTSSSSSPEHSAMMSMLQELLQQNKQIREELAALKSKVSNQAAPLPGASAELISDWHCMIDNLDTNRATCIDPANAQIRILHRLVTKPFPMLNPQVFVCEPLENGMTHCQGEELEYITLPTEDTQATSESISTTLVNTALLSATMGALPEAIGDIFWLTGLVSPKTAEEIKSLANTSLMMITGSWIGAAASWVTGRALEKAGLSPSHARNAGNAVGFAVNTGRTLATGGLGIATTAVSLVAGRFGFWAEKQVVKAAVALQTSNLFMK